ncbi:MAG TPA: hypothetical protein VK956_13445 [Verrucomicrobium sp.]|nr:hypothetical protein [Verrucomicrobium sp.]
MAPEKSARYWQSATRRLARFVNLGWWLENWLTWIMAAALTGAVSVLLVRWLWASQLSWVWIGLSSVVLLGGAVAWFRVRGRFESEDVARVRLEDALGLKARLTAAAAGVGDWPARPDQMARTVLWRWQRPAIMLGLAVAMLALAVWMPMQSRAEAKKRVIEKPSAVKEVEQWVENLRKEQAVEEESLKEVEKKVAELLQRPSENWYEHGSLEAAGNLKEQTSEMLRELSENLSDAERAASALQAAGDAFPQEAKDAVGGELASAAQGLKTGGIKPNEQLLKQLQQMAGAQGMGQLTKEQLEQLAKQLQQNAQALQEALANSPELKLTECRGCKPGEGDKEGPGKGGIDRGPGTAALTFKQDETNLDTKKAESLASQIDISRLAPGDVMGVQNAQHEVDKNSYSGPRQSGGIQNAGDGGAAVWQNSLLPGEREALKRYFK